MQKFFESISQFVTLSEKSKREFSAILIREEFPKGHLLLRPGEVCNFIWFIDEGITRTFYYKDGKDVTDWISPNGTFALSLISFLTRKPDRRGIELLEQCILWAIPFYELENLYKTNHEIEHMGRLITNHGLIQLQERFDDLHFATAAERYKKLCETSPTILQRVSLGIIASYLGITQETLSRIRANI